jgi:hypothetical protein
MKYITILMIGILLFNSCKSKNNKVQSNNTNDTISQKTEIEINTSNVKVDSITELKRMGQRIVEGEKLTEFNEKYLYQLVHNIITKDSAERVFYFKVFNVIRSQAGGYLAEDIDFYTKRFCNDYPNDFFCLSDSLLRSYADDLGELIRTEEESPTEFADKFYQSIRTKSNPIFYEKIDRFYEDIKKAIKARS